VPELVDQNATMLGVAKSFAPASTLPMLAGLMTMVHSLWALLRLLASTLVPMLEAVIASGTTDGPPACETCARQGRVVRGFGPLA
jgi:hypothetical protein